MSQENREKMLELDEDLREISDQFRILHNKLNSISKRLLYLVSSEADFESRNNEEELLELLGQARKERNIKSYDTETASELIDESSIETMINTIEYLLGGDSK